LTCEWGIRGEHQPLAFAQRRVETISSASLRDARRSAPPTAGLRGALSPLIKVVLDMILNRFKNNGGRSCVSDAVVSRSKSNFAAAFFLLPERKRRAVKTFYAFCRELDDGVDGAPDRGAAMACTRFWREEIGRVRDGGTLSPLGEEIRDVVKAFGLSLEYFDLIIEGVETDITKNRHETFEQLYEYCYRVASSVGFVCLQVMGVTGGGAMRYAELTGVGVQLTNILRDVREDAQMGRIYLPLEDLELFGVSEEDVLRVRESDNLFRLLHFEAARAESFFRLGQWTLTPADSVRLYFCHLLAGTYAAILEKLRSERFGLRQGKVKVPTSRKLQMGVKSAMISIFGSMPYL
jgi:phytoene synthase